MGLLRKEDMHESFWKEGVSNPNLLINGDFQVWQRGTSFNYDSINNFNIYTADRWRLIQSGEGATAKVIKTSEIEENTLTIMEFTKPSGIEMALSQKLDYPLSKEDGKSYTLSLSYSSNLNAELCIREYDPNIDIGSVPMPSSTNINTVSLTFNSSKLSKKNNRVEIYIRFSSEETYNNSAINLSNIKLEIGSSATVFSSRHYGEELALCQRYYQSNSSTSWYLFHRAQGGGLRCDIPCEAMRTTPTLVFPSETIDIFNTDNIWESIPKSKCKITQSFASQITIVIDDVNTPGLADNRSYIAKNIPCFDDEIY